MLVTQAGPGDVGAVAPLFAKYRAFYGQPLDVAVAEAFLEARLRNDDSVIFLARIGDRVVGFTQLYPFFSSVNASRTWILNDLFVDEGARRQGVASALLEAARQHGKASGATGLTLQTTRDNATAQALYAKHGWTRQTDFYWYDLELRAVDGD